MKKILFAILLGFVGISASAVEVPPPPVSKADSVIAAGEWKPSGNTGVNISQVSFTNWSQGGENSLTWSLFFNFGLNKNFEKFRLKNQLKVAYGMTKIGDEPFKTNENEIFLETVLTYKLAWNIDPYFSNTVRTVIADGYDYAVKPKKQISTFWDPGYLTQSFGFAFDKIDGLNTRLGVAFQETFTNKFRQYTTDADHPDRTFKFETGVESVTSYKCNFSDNLLYQGRFRLFGRFDNLDVWDVRFDNTLTAKITKYINVNFTALVVHEISQTRRTQLKQGLQFGFIYNLF